MGDPREGKPSLPASPETSREMTLGEGGAVCANSDTVRVSNWLREKGMFQNGAGGAGTGLSGG